MKSLSQSKAGKKTLSSLGVFLVFLTGLLVPDEAPGKEAASSVRRFALIVGSNDGGKERVKLLYANSDAESFSRVLSHLGGLRTEDRLLLLDPDRAALEEGLRKMQALLSSVRAKDTRIEFVFYYSGHSDEEGILLFGERFAYKDLRTWLDGLSADVKIAVFDSCASGAFTRSKGGTQRPPFLADHSSKVKGHAFLTSSSADETAQESDRIGSSFFTHSLISGLRGAADSNQDSKVTLHEVYQFAFQETLERTERTLGGPQHPAYDIQLVGSGDLVLTDLRSTSATLLLKAELEGRFYFRDSQGRLVVELRKVAGQSLELGLEPGSYQVILEAKEGRYQAPALLVRNRKTSLGARDFTPIKTEATVARGAEEAAPEEAAEALGDIEHSDVPAFTPVEDEYAYYLVPVNLALSPQLSLSGLRPGKTITWMGLSVVGHTDRLYGLETSLGLSLVDEHMAGTQISVGGNLVRGDAAGIQVSGVFNWVNGRMDGLQVAGGASYAGSDVTVGQVSGGVNWAGSSLFGMQVAGGVNGVEGQVAGIQVAGGVNLAGGDFLGVQTAGGANLVGGYFKGLQVAGGMNIVGGDFSGLQVGSGNLARRLDGMQVGVVNIGGDVKGAQIGVVNIAKKAKGAQIGVLNIADEVDGLPLGIVSYVRQGQFHLSFFASDVNDLNASLKMGGKSLYTLFTAGAAEDENKLRYSVGLGFGGHLEHRSLFFDLDLVSQMFRAPSRVLNLPGYMATLRFLGGLKLFPGVAVFAGPTANAMLSFEGADLDFGGLFFERVFQKDEVTLRLSTGFTLGVQLF